MSFKPGRYKLRNGDDYELLIVDKPGHKPLFGYRVNDGFPLTHYEDGRIYGNGVGDEFDIMLPSKWWPVLTGFRVPWMANEAFDTEEEAIAYKCDGYKTIGAWEQKE